MSRRGRATTPAPAQHADDRAAPAPAAVLDMDTVDGVICDVDGVVTDTARVHAASWKRAFDELLRGRARQTGVPMKPFDMQDDYLRYVDGKPRLDGLRSFLAARGITLPEGEPTDPADSPTVHGLSRRKNEYFHELLYRSGVLAFGSTVNLLRQLRQHGLRTAAVSSSRNSAEVLTAAGVAELFEVRVDGVDAVRLGLAGKPDPALFLEAARRLSIPPIRLAVVEDAYSGVAAGRRGGFGFVIGVDRGAHAEGLRRSGAHVVVQDLGQLSLRGRHR